ncbi:MAG: biotin transporter BioY [bacterium]|nr:biotin transporter BioY [bacterium]
MSKRVNLSTREITKVSLFTSLAIASSIIVRLGTGTMLVPFSLLPMIALLSGMILGPKLGALSMFVYLLLGLMGVPVFASPPYGGFGYILKPTFGFLLGFILASWLAGKIMEKARDSLKSYFLASFLGLLAIYLVGLPYLYIILNFYLGKTTDIAGVLKLGFFPFIIPDIVKSIISSIFAKVIVSRLENINIREHQPL